MSGLDGYLPLAEFAERYPQMGSLSALYRMVEDRNHNGLVESGALGRSTKWLLHPGRFEAWIQDRAAA